MPDTFLQYRGLKPGEHSWFYNRLGGQVAVLPGEWVRLDLDRHPEVRIAIAIGAATIESLAPPEADVLDEDSDSNRERNPYGKVFSPTPPRRERSQGRPEVLALAIEEIDLIARRFLPWPKWQSDLKMGFTDARPDRRGARSFIALPPPFEKNFSVLYRLAVLKARRRSSDLRRGLAAAVRRAWKGYDFESMKACRRHVHRSHKIPRRDDLVCQYLHEWGAWDGPRLPTARTLRLQRASLGADSPVHEYVDEQILAMRDLAAQRVIFGPATKISFGPWVPKKAASILASAGTPVGCVEIDVTPSYDEAPVGVKRHMQIHFKVERPAGEALPWPGGLGAPSTC